MSVDSLMQQTLTLQRESVSLDDAGGQTIDSWSAVDNAAGIACSVQPASGSVTAFYNQRGLLTSHSIYIGKDVRAKAGMRVMVTAYGAASYYMVKGYVENSAGRNKVWRIDAEEVTGQV